MKQIWGAINPNRRRLSEAQEPRLIDRATREWDSCPLIERSNARGIPSPSERSVARLWDSCPLAVSGEAASRGVPEDHPNRRRLSEAKEFAARVGFEPRPAIENTELKGFRLPHDSLDPHKN